MVLVLINILFMFRASHELTSFDAPLSFSFGNT
jgi:hypothetical protein